ncbi:MAG: MFS transporter [Paracoccaceae bacterium]
MSLVISNRSYRYLFSATAISNLGDGLSALAFPWLASLLTRDPFLIRMITFSNRLPWFLLTLPIGVITDHYDRRGLIINADIVRLCLTCGVLGIILALPEAHNSNEMTSIGFLALLAFGLGSAEVVRNCRPNSLTIHCVAF